MNYLNIEEVIFIHHRIIVELQPENNQFNILSPNALESAIDRPKRTAFGTEIFADVFSKAAALTDAIIKTHPFQDGNKRVGIVSGIVFMKNNGYEINANNDDVFNSAHNLSVDFWLIEDITKWFGKYFHFID